MWNLSEAVLQLLILAASVRAGDASGFFFIPPNDGPEAEYQQGTFLYALWQTSFARCSFFLWSSYKDSGGFQSFGLANLTCDGRTSYSVFLGDNIDLTRDQHFHLVAHEIAPDDSLTGNTVSSRDFTVLPRSSVVSTAATLNPSPGSVATETILVTPSVPGIGSSSSTTDTATSGSSSSAPTTYVSSGYTSSINSNSTGFHSATLRTNHSSVTDSATSPTILSSPSPMPSSESKPNSAMEIGVGLGVGLLCAVGLASIVVGLLARLRKRQRARRAGLQKRDIRVLRPGPASDRPQTALREMAGTRTTREVEATGCRGRPPSAADWNSGIVLEARESMSDSGWWNVAAPALWREDDGRSTRS